jgi:nitroimidazol reductase NimA-like FMN-containing flavoprotein (pyridoxamine 5'-phosphate oxidase superfamily)
MYHYKEATGGSEPIMGQSPPSGRATVRRHPERAAYDEASVASILDEALVCHLGLIDNGYPRVIPTTHARLGRTLYVHGSPASQLLRLMTTGIEACVTVTLIDGLVLARSWLHHSLNYRSVVIFGPATLVQSPEGKREALHALVEHVAPGRPDGARPPTDQELAGVLVLALPLTEASVKVRSGPPIDLDSDHRLDLWAGEVPLALTAGPPVPDPRLRPGIGVPDHVARWCRPGPA